MDNCKVIAIANQKGGVGKTTTTVNLGVGLLLILGLALGFRSFERIETKSIVIPFSDGKEGMDPSEEADKEIKAVPLEEVESFSDFEISTIVLTEEKEPVSEKKQEQREEVSSYTSEGHSFSAGNEKQETKEPVSSGDYS